MDMCFDVEMASGEVIKNLPVLAAFDKAEEMTGSKVVGSHGTIYTYHGWKENS